MQEALVALQVPPELPVDNKLPFHAYLIGHQNNIYFVYMFFLSTLNGQDKLFVSRNALAKKIYISFLNMSNYSISRRS